MEARARLRWALGRLGHPDASGAAAATVDESITRKGAEHSREGRGSRGDDSHGDSNGIFGDIAKATDDEKSDARFNMTTLPRNKRTREEHSIQPCGQHDDGVSNEIEIEDDVHPECRRAGAEGTEENGHDRMDGMLIRKDCRERSPSTGVDDRAVAIGKNDGYHEEPMSKRSVPAPSPAGGQERDDESKRSPAGSAGGGGGNREGGGRVDVDERRPRARSYAERGRRGSTGESRMEPMEDMENRVGERSRAGSCDADVQAHGDDGRSDSCSQWIRDADEHAWDAFRSQQFRNGNGGDHRADKMGDLEQERLWARAAIPSDEHREFDYPSGNHIDHQPPHGTDTLPVVESRSGNGDIDNHTVEEQGRLSGHSGDIQDEEEGVFELYMQRQQGRLEYNRENMASYEIEQVEGTGTKVDWLESGEWDEVESRIGAEIPFRGESDQRRAVQEMGTGDRAYFNSRSGCSDTGNNKVVRDGVRTSSDARGRRREESHVRATLSSMGFQAANDCGIANQLANPRSARIISPGKTSTLKPAKAQNVRARSARRSVPAVGGNGVRRVEVVHVPTLPRDLSRAYSTSTVSRPRKNSRNNALASSLIRETGKRRSGASVTRATRQKNNAASSPPSQVVAKSARHRVSPRPTTSLGAAATGPGVRRESHSNAAGRGTIAERGVSSVNGTRAGSGIVSATTATRAKRANSIGPGADTTPAVRVKGSGVRRAKSVVAQRQLGTSRTSSAVSCSKSIKRRQALTMTPTSGEPRRACPPATLAGQFQGEEHSPAANFSRPGETPGTKSRENVSLMRRRREQHIGGAQRVVTTPAGKARATSSVCSGSSRAWKP